jgi:prevent-host-death family protein
MGLTFMTSSGYLQVMKGVRVAELKARLSEYLRRVRRGHTLTVLDRSTPIAWIVPYTSEAVSLTVRQPSPDSPGLHRIALPPPLDLEVDVVAVLLEERQGER